MNNSRTRGPLGASLRLRAHAEEHNDIAPRTVLNRTGTITDDVLAYCARHELTITWLLTSKSPAMS